MIDGAIAIFPYLKNPNVQKFLGSLLVIFILWLSKWILIKLAESNIKDAKALFSTKKTIGYLIVVVGLMVIGRIWFKAFDSFATYLGLLSAGIAIALRDMLVNMVGWIFIIWRKPFVIGNRIQIGQHSGDVIDIRLFQFSILEIGNWVKADQSTGRIIHVPNGQVFLSPLCNYDQGFQYIWNEIPVLITFESDWQEAKLILQEIVDKLPIADNKTAEAEIIASAKKYLIFYKKISPTVYTSVEDSGVLLTIRYLTEIRKRRGSSEQIWEMILTRFAEHPEIDLAYPTYRRV
jgi:small-conductance mechanosensitive channel